MNAELGKNEFYIECNCHCGSGVRISLMKYNEGEENELYIYNQSSRFTSEQHSFKQRLEEAWRVFRLILNGENYHHHELILDKDDMKALGKWIRKYVK